MPRVNLRRGWSPKSAVLRVCPQAYAMTERLPLDGAGYTSKNRSVYESRGGRLLGRDTVGTKAWEAALATLVAEGRTKPFVPITAGRLTMTGTLVFCHWEDGPPIG